VSFAAVTLRVASQRATPKGKGIFRYRLNPETFGYTLVHDETTYLDAFFSQSAEKGRIIQ
jgi:hypothetical protein